MMADPLERGCPSGLAPPTEDRASDFSAFVRETGREKALSLSVRGAKCGGCLSKIEGALQALPGVTAARMNLSTGATDVRWTGSLDPNRVAQTVRDLGYGVSARAEANDADLHKAEERKLLVAMGVAGFAAANIMLLSVSVWGGHGEMGEATRRGLHAISGLIALPAIIFSGRHFFSSAWSVLRKGKANMDVPISLAVILAFSVSVWATIKGAEHAYFDACVMLLFFLLIGRFLDARLRRRAYSAALDLASLQNRSVNRLSANGEVNAVRAAEVVAGDKLLLAAGERAVVDMTILDGASEIDESLVTGESLPRLASAGSTLFAGSVNLGAPLTGQALAGTEDSLLSDIARMMEAGEQRRSGYRKIADRAVSLYVPFVHTTAALAFLGWLMLGAGVEHAIMIAVTTLIITCPCALALAAPVAQVVASGRLFRKGVFLKSGDALERLSEIDHIVFDKTGTLTLGEPELMDVDSIPADILVMAASLARASRHPLSRALVAAAGPGHMAANVKEQPGLGLEAEIDGKICRLGSADWTGAPQDAAKGPVLWFTCGDDAPVRFDFRDTAQAGTRKTVETLQAKGYELEVLSGDREEAVAAVSRDVGINRWTASASPAVKVKRLEALRAEGHNVLMVGDGLNDAGALSLAHAALAPGTAMDISQSASDAVYSGGPEKVPFILETAKRAQNITRQNFGLAAIYNVIAVPIAVTGHVTPLVAAIAMSASSLIVTLNALRIEAGGRS
ncbi:heavy metal translocating P-type ATPase [Hyphomonas pacifica]|nr:heavy metal translocating P-type ATPase [Hyphomonas pacifica]